MKLQDRINELAGKDFVKKILITEDVSNPTDKENFKLSVKHVHYLDASGAVMTVTKAKLFVLDEKTEKEEAYFQDTYPVSRVRHQTVQEMETNEDGTVYKVEKLVDTSGMEKIVADKKIVDSGDTKTVATK